MTRPAFTGYSPFKMCRSVPQMVVSVTRITASPEPGRGIETCSIPIWFGPRNTSARIVDGRTAFLGVAAWNVVNMVASDGSFSLRQEAQRAAMTRVTANCDIRHTRRSASRLGGIEVKCRGNGSRVFIWNNQNENVWPAQPCESFPRVCGPRHVEFSLRARFEAAGALARCQGRHAGSDPQQQRQARRLLLAVAGPTVQHQPAQGDQYACQPSLPRAQSHDHSRENISGSAVHVQRETRVAAFEKNAGTQCCPKVICEIAPSAFRLQPVSAGGLRSFRPSSSNAKYIRLGNGGWRTAGAPHPLSHDRTAPCERRVPRVAGATRPRD